MKKTALFLAVFCLMIVSVVAQTYTYEVENFNGIISSYGNEKWCYSPLNAYNSRNCGAKTSSLGAAVIDISASANPINYTLTDIPNGNYNISIRYFDRTAAVDPKIKIGSQSYILTNRPTSMQIINIGTQRVNTGDVIILTVENQGGSSSSYYIGIDKLIFEQLPEEQSHQNPELSIIGILIAITVITAYLIFTRKK